MLPMARAASAAVRPGATSGRPMAIAGLSRPAATATRPGPTTAPKPARRRRDLATPAAASSAAALTTILPPQYGLVLASLASTALLLQVLAVRVALARRQYGVEYPQLYRNDGSADGKTFDCIQRAHQNTLETAAPQMLLIALLGLAHPVPAATAQFAWFAGRVAYGIGYSTGEPNKRLPGVAVAGLVYVGTIVAALYEGARMVVGSS